MKKGSRSVMIWGISFEAVSVRDLLKRRKASGKASCVCVAFLSRRENVRCNLLPSGIFGTPLALRIVTVYPQEEQGIFSTGGGCEQKDC